LAPLGAGVGVGVGAGVGKGVAFGGGVAEVPGDAPPDEPVDDELEVPLDESVADERPLQPVARIEMTAAAIANRALFKLFLSNGFE
jgi:hypothetical protein